jgi:hypothetical protein
MEDVRAIAVRRGGVIEITVMGKLANSYHQARIEDIYPGGDRVYVVDPGAAQVFVEETVSPGSQFCMFRLFPWAQTVNITDKTHDKVAVFVNEDQVLETDLLDEDSQFIVIALTDSPPGQLRGCSVVPEDTHYPVLYEHVFGPASNKECQAWIHSNCSTS